MTTPLLGAVDTAVVGQLNNPAYIGGVAVGTIIFNTLFWLFGFLRVSTSGFSAQAHGANDNLQGILALTRPFMIAIIVGICFILLQWPIKNGALQLINPGLDVQMIASDYFNIRIWSAPFALMNYVILGWLMGMSQIKGSLFIQIFMNVMNIVLDLLFVAVFSWGVSGVAIASLLSEMTAFIAGLLLIWKISPYKFKVLQLKDVVAPAAIKKMMSVNRDLFIRTICLLTVFNIFTAKGASFGTETLAANAILIQIHYIMAYFFDGFANASSIVVGRAIGLKDRALYKKILRLSIQWAAFSSIIIAVAYYLCRDFIVPIFTQTLSVIDLINTYGIWIIVFPLTASFGIVLYGVFTGATEVTPVRNSMVFASVVFLIVLYVSVPNFGNHGVWLAFIVFSIGRSLFLGLYIPYLTQKLFPKRDVNNKEIQMI
jgi:MATE family multidrug resistance protein